MNVHGKAESDITIEILFVVEKKLPVSFAAYICKHNNQAEWPEKTYIDMLFVNRSRAYPFLGPRTNRASNPQTLFEVYDGLVIINVRHSSIRFLINISK